MRKQNPEHFLRASVLILITVGFLFASGCRTTQPIPLVEKPPQYTYLYSARVVRVNEEHRYAILKCAVTPAVGDIGMLCRSGQSIGRLRVNNNRRSDYVAADIMSGQPQQNKQVIRDKE